MLAGGIAPPWLVVLVGASLLVTYAIVFAAGFSDDERRRAQAGVLQRPLTDTGMAYLVSLAISAALLWFFGNLPGQAATLTFVFDRDQRTGDLSVSVERTGRPERHQPKPLEPGAGLGCGGARIFSMARTCIWSWPTLASSRHPWSCRWSAASRAGWITNRKCPEPPARKRRQRPWSRLPGGRS